jgi:hypothetical protein
LSKNNKLGIGNLVIQILLALFVVFFLFFVNTYFINLDISTLIAIGFFNFLFLFLLFPLEGSFLLKFFLLILGNQVGVFWFIIQRYVGNFFLFLSPDTYKILTVVVKPFFDFMWIVIIWSFSLSRLIKTKKDQKKC